MDRKPGRVSGFGVESRKCRSIATGEDTALEVRKYFPSERIHPIARPEGFGTCLAFQEDRTQGVDDEWARQLSRSWKVSRSWKNVDSREPLSLEAVAPVPAGSLGECGEHHSSRLRRRRRGRPAQIRTQHRRFRSRESTTCGGCLRPLG